MSYRIFTRGEPTRFTTSTPQDIRSNMLLTGLCRPLELRYSIQSVTPLSSACALTALQKATALSAPCSYDNDALRAPAIMMMLGNPFAAATSIPSCRAVRYPPMASFIPIASQPGGPAGGGPAGTAPA